MKIFIDSMYVVTITTTKGDKWEALFYLKDRPTPLEIVQAIELASTIPLSYYEIEDYRVRYKARYDQERRRWKRLRDVVEFAAYEDDKQNRSYPYSCRVITPGKNCYLGDLTVNMRDVFHHPTFTGAGW